MPIYTYKHHIIPYHEWKKRINIKATRYDKEFNASDNVVWLTLEQHIQVHQLLFELNGCAYDRIAYLGLSGQIGEEEVHRLTIIVTNTGRKHTEEYKQQKSKDMMGNQCCKGKNLCNQFAKWKNLGNQWAKGYKHTEEFKQQKSLEMMGNKNNKKGSHSSPSTEFKKGCKGNVGSQPLVTCPHCLKSGGVSNMHRYHFNNCPKFKKA